MKYLNRYKLFESNSFKFFKGTYGINCEFRCDLGKGKALLMNNDSTINIPFKMNDDEIFLFGIDTTPRNSGVGMLFLNRIFDEFKLSKIYHHQKIIQYGISNKNRYYY